MVKANRKTLIFNPLSLAFIFFHKTYVKIQDLTPIMLLLSKRWQSVTVSLIILLTAFVAPKPSFAATGDGSIHGIPTAELFGAIDVKDSELIGTDAFKARISSNETYVEFKNQDKSYWIKSVPVGFKKVRGRTQREIITFEGVMDGVTLKEKLYEGKTKEEIWLLSRESPTSFMFVLSHSDNLILKKDGEDILLSEINSNKEMGRIEAPFAVDAKGTRYRYTYTLKGNTLVLEPVSSLDGAIYPLAIDPSYTIVTGALTNGTPYNFQRKLARSSNGGLHCVYHRLATVNNIFYAKSTDGGQTWTETALTSEAANAQDSASIAVDGNDYLHIVWRGGVGGVTNLRYRQYTTAWQPITELTSEALNQHYPSIAVDSGNNLHVVWYGNVAGYTDYQIRYIKKTSGTWGSIQNLTTESYMQATPTIAIDGNDYLHVAWYGKYSGSTTIDQIRYCKYTTSWQSIENLTSDSVTQYRPCIAVDGNNYIHIVWNGTYGGGPANMQVRYIKNAGGTWDASPTTLTSDNADQQWPSISVDASNNLHAVWFGLPSALETLYQIRYKKCTGGTWDASVTNLTDSTTGSQRYPNMIWARWPTVFGNLTNRPETGYAFIWADGTTVKYYCSSDLTFPTGTWTTSGGNTIITFRSSGRLVYTGSLMGASVLVVAGGGGGGGGNVGNAGGGGAGGVVYATGVTLSGTMTVTVGAGGAGGTTGSSTGGTNGSNGSNSVFGTLATAIGGGGGSKYAGLHGENGGSGGGTGQYYTGSEAAGTGTSGQGNNGGIYGSTGGGNGLAGGGGGGAGAVGGNSTVTTPTPYGGVGGAGSQYSISGTATYYAGGGAAASHKSVTNISAGGSGGGGSGGNKTTAPTAGTAYTGGGGGGGSDNPTAGGAGGSGIVIISYPTNSAVTLYPNAAGTNAQWTWTTGGSANYTNWQTNDGDTTYAYAVAKDLVQTVKLDDTALSGTINSVTVYAVCEQTTGDEVIQLCVKTGATSTNYFSASTAAIATTYTAYSNTWATNPSTSAAWTWSQINALEAGVESIASGGWTGEERCTQVYVVVDYTPPNFNQTHYRWRNDDGGEGGASWKAAEDTEVTGQAKNENIRLRFAIANTGGAPASSYQYLLEYSTSTGGPWYTVPVTATTEPFEMTATAWYADNGSTTGQLTGTRTWQAGTTVADPSNKTASYSLPGGYYTEFEYCFKATDASINPGTYYFRLTNNGTALDTYSTEKLAKITIAGATVVTLVGDGTSPANKFAGPSATNKAVSAFTLSKNTGTDTVTQIVVTGTNTANVAASGVKIYQDNGLTPNEWDSGDTLITNGTASFSGATATFSSLSIPVTMTSTQYIITYNIVGSPTNGQTLTGVVTSATATNPVTNNDTTDATITIDAAVPTTTATASGGYIFGTWTATSPVSITLSANDGTGSGLASGYPKYCVDTTNACSPATSYTVAFDVTCASGSTCTQYVRYQSVDNVGNTETVNSSQVKQDCQAPTSGASFSATSGDTQCSLTWTAASDGGSGMHSTQPYEVRKQQGSDPGSCAGGTQLYIGTGLSTTATGLTNGLTYYYRLCYKDTVNNQSQYTGNPVTCTPIVITTTVGDGTNPANASLCPGGAATMLDAFTLQTSTGTDTVTNVTVTLTPTASFNNIGLIEITNDLGGVVYGSVTNPAADAVTITTAGLSATTTSTQYQVRITPRTHANMPVPPGASYAVTGTITAITSTNTKTYSDTTSATVTIDNASPSNAIWGTITPGDQQITLNWTNPVDGDFNKVLILRKTSSISDAPAEGTIYAASGTIGTSIVVYVGNGATFTDTGLTNGTSYYYKVFAYDTCINYATGTQTGPYSAPSLTYPASPYNDGKNPDTGDTTTDFTFKVIYTNAGNTPPAAGYPKLYIGDHDGFMSYTMTAEDPVDTNYTDGKTYYFTTGLGAAQDLRFYFEAQASAGNTCIIRLPSNAPTSFNPGPSVYLLYGNNMVGVPKNLGTGLSYSGVLGDDSGYLYCYTWDSAGLDTGPNFNGLWIDCASDNVQTGKGYYIWSTASNYWRLDEPSGIGNVTAANFDIDLKPNGGWTMISNPYNGIVQLLNIKIVRSSTEYLFSQAVTNGWIDNSIYAYEGPITGYTFSVYNDTPPATLKPWVGYFIYVKDTTPTTLRIYAP